MWLRAGEGTPLRRREALLVNKAALRPLILAGDNCVAETANGVVLG